MPFYSDEVVILKFVRVAEKFREVHARNVILAAHLIDSIENLSLGDQFFLANILKQLRQRSEKHKVLTRLAFQSLRDFGAVLILVYIENSLVGHTHLIQVEALLGCLLGAPDE